MTHEESSGLDSNETGSQETTIQRGKESARANPKQAHQLTITAKLETQKETIDLEASLQTLSSGQIKHQQLTTRLSSIPSKSDIM